MNAVEGLAREIARVAVIKEHMLDLPGGVGRPGAALMEMSLERAFVAAGSNDAIQVIQAVEDLHGYSE